MNRTFGTLLAAALLAQASVALAQTNAQPRAAIGYTSVAEALAALRAKPGVQFSRNGDWTVAEDTDRSLWSFTPANHYAHPSVGRRTLIEQQGAFFVRTEILCQAQKVACDRLRDDYNLLDQRMNEAVRARK